jgi:hypothetical protein
LVIKIYWVFYYLLTSMLATCYKVRANTNAYANARANAPRDEGEGHAQTEGGTHRKDGGEGEGAASSEGPTQQPQ